MSASRSPHVPAATAFPGCIASLDDLDGIDLGDVLPDSPVAHVIRDDDEAIHIAEHLVPILARGAIDRGGLLPLAELPLLSASGLLGITVPMEHGGADVTADTVAEVVRLLALADPDVAQISHAHVVQVDVLRGMRSPALQARLFAEILAGRRLSCVDTGRPTDPSDRVTLRRCPDGALTLDGVAHTCTGALVAHWFAVHADDAGQPVTVFVPAGTPGLTVTLAGHDSDTTGDTGTVRVSAATGTIHLDDVTVDPTLVARTA